ncbi:MAG: hypothetical protein K2J34_09245, partial [Muribaculaceae bacterium]|nr:hypothetical protein [Muribaculaceae bacterium]
RLKDWIPAMESGLFILFDRIPAMESGLFVFQYTGQRGGGWKPPFHGLRFFSDVCGNKYGLIMLEI